MIQANRLNFVEEYYFSKKLREVSRLVSQGRDIINLGIGSPDLFPPQSSILALTKSLNYENSHKYQSYQGIPELRQEISNYYKVFFNTKLCPENEVLPLIGSKEGIMHISMAFLNEGDGVLVPNPGYPTYLSVSKIIGANINFYDLSPKNKWLPDLNNLMKKDLSKVKLMWINYPHMPTGAISDTKFYKKMIDFAKEKNILIVNDNPYAHILNNNPTSILSIPGAKKYCLELQSFSKAYNMSGWRIGMVSGHEKYIKTILKIKSNMDSGMFLGIQKGAIAALKEGKKWFTDLNKKYAIRRNLIYSLARELDTDFEKNTAGMFVWAKLPSGKKSSELFIENLLSKYDIFVAPGIIFGDKGEGYIRFSLCISETKIKEAIKRVKK